MFPDAIDPSMRLTTFFTRRRSYSEPSPKTMTGSMSLSQKLRQLFPKPRRRLYKNWPRPHANKEASTACEARKSPEKKRARNCEKTQHDPSTPVTSNVNGSDAAEIVARKRPHSIGVCVLLKALVDDNGVPETVPLSPITEESSTTRPSPEFEDETGRFASSSRPSSVYVDKYSQTDDVPSLSSCSCRSRPSREGTPSTPPLLTPTESPANWKEWSESDMGSQLCSSVEKSPNVKDADLSRSFSSEAEDEDELAFYRKAASARPASGLGAFLEAMPSPEAESVRCNSSADSPQSSPLILRRATTSISNSNSDSTCTSNAGDQWSSEDYSPERPRTRQRGDSADTPRSTVWAPHQLTAIPEDDEWACESMHRTSSSESDGRGWGAPSTPSRTPSSSLRRSSWSINSPRKELDEYAREVKPTVIQSIAVYAGAFFRSQKLIDPDMSPGEVQDSLEAVLLAAIDDIVGSLLQTDMAKPLREYFSPYVPEIAAAMISGLGREGRRGCESGRDEEK